MKKSIVWVVLLATVVTTFNACKEDDPPPIPAIVGTWSLTKYQLTQLPAGFKKAEGYEDAQIYGYELGYTFVFSADGTYTRAFNVVSQLPSVTDKGKWTLDGTKLVVKPDDADDLDLIEDYGIIGLEFAVVGDISEIRMVLSRVVALFLLPDSFDTTKTPTDSDFKQVDLTLVYKFNKL